MKVLYRRVLLLFLFQVLWKLYRIFFNAARRQPCTLPPATLHSCAQLCTNCALGQSAPLSALTHFVALLAFIGNKDTYVQSSDVLYTVLRDTSFLQEFTLFKCGSVFKAPRQLQLKASMLRVLRFTGIPWGVHWLLELLVLAGPRRANPEFEPLVPGDAWCINSQLSEFWVLL